MITKHKMPFQFDGELIEITALVMDEEDFAEMCHFLEGIAATMLSEEASFGKTGTFICGSDRGPVILIPRVERIQK